MNRQNSVATHRKQSEAKESGGGKSVVKQHPPQDYKRGMVPAWVIWALFVVALFAFATQAEAAFQIGPMTTNPIGVVGDVTGKLTATQGGYSTSGTIGWNYSFYGNATNVVAVNGEAHFLVYRQGGGPSNQGDATASTSWSWSQVFAAGSIVNICVRIQQTGNGGSPTTYQATTFTVPAAPVATKKITMGPVTNPYATNMVMQFYNGDGSGRKVAPDAIIRPGETKYFDVEMAGGAGVRTIVSGTDPTTGAFSGTWSDVPNGAGVTLDSEGFWVPGTAPVVIHGGTTDNDPTLPSAVTNAHSTNASGGTVVAQNNKPVVIFGGTSTGSTTAATNGAIATGFNGLASQLANSTKAITDSIDGITFTGGGGGSTDVTGIEDRLDTIIENDKKHTNDPDLGTDQAAAATDALTAQTSAATDYAEDAMSAFETARPTSASVSMTTPTPPSSGTNDYGTIYFKRLDGSSAVYHVDLFELPAPTVVKFRYFCHAMRELFLWGMVFVFVFKFRARVEQWFVVVMLTPQNTTKVEFSQVMIPGVGWVKQTAYAVGFIVVIGAASAAAVGFMNTDLNSVISGATVAGMFDSFQTVVNGQLAGESTFNYIYNQISEIFPLLAAMQLMVLWWLNVWLIPITYSIAMMFAKLVNV